MQAVESKLQQAVRLSPNNGLAQGRLALVTLTNEVTPAPRLVASAEWQSRRGLELSPEEPDAWRVRAEFCEHLGRIPEAIAAMDRAIGLSPTNASFWNSKGLLLEKTNRLEEALHNFTKAIELSGPWKNGQSLPALGYENRSKVYRSLNRLADAGADNLKGFNVPRREPGTPATLIDLSLFFNNLIDEMPPAGRRTLAGGREFDIKAIVVVGANQGDTGAPGEVLGIPISQKCRRLHFLHVGLKQKKKDGTEVGVYRLHYADGQQKEIPIIYGAHFRLYSQADDPNEALAKNTRVAWVGDTPTKTRIQLFEMTWENERPDVAIESLDFISRKTGTAPILFAITAEP